MTNITGESSVTVTLTGATAGKLTLDELRDWISYLDSMALPGTTACNIALVSGGMPRVSADVPANSFIAYSPA